MSSVLAPESAVFELAVALAAGALAAGALAVAFVVSFALEAPAAVALGARRVVAVAVGSVDVPPGPPDVASPGPLLGVHAPTRTSADISGPLSRFFVLQGETKAMITVEGLYKSYSGSTFAVRDVSFRVKKGEIVGFLGPNGAGKSTTLRVVAGFLGATAGKVTLAGHDIAEAPTEARAAVGYMPESVPLYPEMRVREYLAFRAELKHVPRKKRREAVDASM